MTVINTTDLTTEETHGTGVFDELMSAVEAHLNSQFDKGAITGSSYAEVYLGSMQSVLSESVAFLLSKQKAGLEADLISKQIEIADIEKANATKQGALLDEQILIAKQDVLLRTAQVVTETNQAANLASQNAVIVAEGALLASRKNTEDANTAKVTAEVVNINKEGAVLDQQVLNLQQEVLESVQRTTNLVSTELKIDEETKLISQQYNNAVTQNTTLVRQQDKLIAETNLLDQKTVTETAQTTTGTYTGIVGAQRQLYEKQRDGFDRDAEQKAAKIWTDTWSVRRSTDSGVVADATNALHDVTGGALMQKLVQGVNA